MIVGSAALHLLASAAEGQPPLASSAFPPSLAPSLIDPFSPVEEHCHVKGTDDMITFFRDGTVEIAKVGWKEVVRGTYRQAARDLVLVTSPASPPKSGLETLPYFHASLGNGRERGSLIPLD
jgi:hypothetical protein